MKDKLLTFLAGVILTAPIWLLILNAFYGLED